MLKKIIFTIFNILFFINSSAQIKKNKKFDLGPILANNDPETLLMVNMLQELNDSGDPINNYHWNKKLADLLPSESVIAIAELFAPASAEETITTSPFDGFKLPS